MHPGVPLLAQADRCSLQPESWYNQEVTVYKMRFYDLSVDFISHFASRRPWQEMRD